MPDENIIFVLTINHRHGAYTAAFRSAEGATKDLAGYVDQNWDEECGRINWSGPKDRPTNPDEMVAEYFAAMPGEWYDLVEVDLLP